MAGTGLIGGKIRVLRREEDDTLKRSESNPADRQRLQAERANRSFELRIDRAPTTAAKWRSLRRALRFSRADDAWLRERVPGTVRTGAEADLVRVLTRVEAAGHRGRVVRRAEPGTA